MQSQAQREISHLISKVRRIASVAINRQLQLVGSSGPEYRVLFQLSLEPELSQNEIAQDAAMDPATVSRLLRAMQEQGLVELRVHPRDRRQRVARLTRTGRRKEQLLSPTVDAALAPISSSLTPRQEAQLLSLLRRVGRAAETLERDPAPGRGGHEP